MTPKTIDEDEIEKQVEAEEKKRREKSQLGDEKGVEAAEITEEMEKSYIDYAMSVIVQRALPSVEDGLKPVHRRILYAMHMLGLDSSKSTMKCARIVGETMGKFHPHGNIAVYDALVRLAQDFSLRYPLIHGQGNFGCFTADTKVKLADGRNLSFTELIQEHKEGKENYCYTIKNGRIGVEKITNPRITKKNVEVIKIILDNNQEIICTPDHKFMLKSEEYKEAQTLTTEDSLMPLYEKEIGISPKINHKIERIEFLKDKFDVYDIEVPNTHNFALASGVFVHNSMDGDSAAADRYTEAKLSKIAQQLIEDIEKETVKMTPNFDNSLKEPDTLPAKLPNLLLNGTTGIAVGMATNIPPHNLTELCDAIVNYIDAPEITIEELAKIVRGPDFPTGGYAMGSGIMDMYKTGKGKIIMRAKISTEDIKGKQHIIITEIPYMVNKAELVKEIARLATEKKLLDVADIWDESAKGKVRVVIELRKGVEAKYTINKLYKMTNLQTNFDANILALVGKQPRLLTLKDVVVEYVNYRKKIVTNRTKFELKKAEDRLEIVLGLLIALKQIDKIVEFIKRSKTGAEAHEGLMKKFELSDRQAKAVLEIRLQQLTSLETEKLKDEQKKLEEIISKLKKILSSETEILKVIKSEVNELKKDYGDDRRTRIIKQVEEISEQDMVEKKDVVVTITNSGYIKRVDLKTYREQRRGGQGVTGTDLKDEDFVTRLLTCSTHDYLLFFTNRGRVYWLKANDVPAGERQGKGRSLANVLTMKDEVIANVMPLRNFESGYLIFATKLGQVKKLPLKDLSKPRATGVRIMNLPPDGSDVIINVERIEEKEEVLLITKKGQAVRFNSDEVRSMGRASYGVKGADLSSNDEVVALEALPKDGKTTILTITTKGYGKRSALDEYRKTSRGAKGVITLKVSDKTGLILTALSVTDKDSIIAMTTKGMMIRTTMKNLRVMGRATQGVHVVRLKEGDKLAGVVKVPSEENIPQGEQKTLGV